MKQLHSMHRNKLGDVIYQVCRCTRFGQCWCGMTVPKAKAEGAPLSYWRMLRGEMSKAIDYKVEEKEREATTMNKTEAQLRRELRQAQGRGWDRRADRIKASLRKMTAPKRKGGAS